MKTEVQKLIERRNQIDREITELRARKSGIDEAIQLLQAGSFAKIRNRREGVREFILDAVKSSDNGIDATGIISLPAAKERKMKKSTVSSMLSRMKGEKVLTFDGHVYRLPDMAQINGVHH